MSLHQAYRPKSLQTFLGNQNVLLSIQKVIEKDPPAAFLITGPPGTGKTTLGRIIARMLKCKKAEYIEIDNGQDRKIESLRAIYKDIRYTPTVGKKKVILFDECHMLLTPAQNSILKMLEEPPDHAHFILCTTEPEKLIPTIKRRCHNYILSTLNTNDCHKLFKKILKKEKVKDYPFEILDKIIDLSDGSPGTALKLLDMVIDIPDAKQAIDVLKSGGTAQTDVIEICRTLCKLDMELNAKWAKLKVLLNSFTGDAESARRPILGYFSAVLLNNPSTELALAMEHFCTNFQDSGKPGLTLACYKACLDIWGA